MALPSNISRRTGKAPMSRADAARNAALVRWKKKAPSSPATGGMSNPAIAARVKEILAEKNKAKGPKGKGKAKGAGGKGKAKGKEKDGRTPQEKANQNRATVSKQTGMDKLEGTLVRLNAGMQGAGMENDKHDELIKKGLAERAADGTVTLSASGKKWKAAADKGDNSAAQGALAEGQAKVANKEAKEKAAGEKKQAAEAKKQASTAEREKKKAERVKVAAEKKQQADKKRKAVAKARGKKASKPAKEPSAKEIVQEAIGRMRQPAKAIDMEIKAGARHSRTDQQHLQGIHDSAVACGAKCGEDEEEAAEKAVKAIYDDPVAYAMHECNDIQAACSSLSNLCFILQSELAEGNDEEDTVGGLVKAARLLIAFIENELDEVEGYDTKPEEPPTVGHEPMKAITEREDVSPKEGEREYGDVQFADTKNKKYPIDTEAHVRSAWNYIAKDENAAKYDPSEVKQIKAKIVAAWKKLIDDAGPPAAGKALDFLHVAGGAIKAVDGDTIGGYAVLFGSADAPDIERDYYTKSTDFWLDHFGWPRPITYHHGMDAATKAAPVIGHWTKATIDDTGVWLEGQLDRAHAYYAAIKQLAERGYLKLSSDSAPQWVVRERQPNGANHVKRWPLVTASTTVTPMEPRMMPVEMKAFLAELGLNDIEDSEAVNPDAASDATKAADDERARAILLELDLIELETQ